MLRRNKKEIWDVYFKQMINIFSVLGKESGGCWRGGYFKLGSKSISFVTL
jgi:hypothetical protein